MHRYLRVGVCALGLLGCVSGVNAVIIYPGVNNPSTAAGLSSPIREAPRVFETFIDSSLLTDVTETMTLSSISFRATPNFSTYAPNYTWPTADLNFANYQITLAKASSASAAANGLQSDTFASNLSDPVVVYSGPLTVPANSFTDTNDGPGPAGSANFSFVIPFTTDYTINPGEDLVVLIRQSGYGSPTQAVTWNYETYAYTNGERVATGDFNATGHNQGTSFRNEAMKFAFEANPVPEPAGAAVLAAAGGLLALRRRFN